MKATLILTTLLGAAIASPVAVANVDANEAERRDLEPRLLSGISIATLIPNGGALTNLNLPALPTQAVTRANIVETLADILRGVLSAILNIREGLPGNLTLPAVPAVPNLPAPGVITDAITLDQLTALVAALQVQVKNATAITQNLPNGLNLLQLQQISVIISEIQTQVTSLTAALTAIPSLPGGIPGANLPGLGGLSDLTTALAPVLSVLSGLLGPLLFGLLSVLSGGLLSSLPGGR
ncbi:hypothetical protein CI238_08930 [Colletotrichum incanum]|uniref:Uncharacterized protein n=1 Tax=Colletotrichum incanum TaxID=1573173 RepID=A0A161VR10_COLIC|nr:hypothetical protein CI238_08930 [Colletotrichum incanum]OHW92298.1 hypothetical protein CSPAE12_09021 [Colletotrichum incanum]